MEKLADYKRLLDALVQLRPSVLAEWVRKRTDWPDTPEDEGVAAFLRSLSPEQREIVARIAQSARDEGIHDVLAYINDEINLGGLRLVVHGKALPVEPFGTELNFDWVARRDGEPWPERDER